VNASTWETLQLLELWVKKKVLLKFTSGKLLSLSNVLYVPSFHRHLVLVYFLIKLDGKLLLEMTKLLFL